jgi:lipoic acid synthetase
MNEDRLKKPIWLRKRLMNNQTLYDVNALLKQCDLHTVCEEAHCPNLGECFSNGTATFLILGNQCTRNCTFCAVSRGKPEKPDKDEPEMVAKAVKKLGLQYVVITSVTRDDLPDGGADHFVETIKTVRVLNPDILVEVLIPDFLGSKNALQRIVKAKPDVINHNVETVPRLYPAVRPMADYRMSLGILRRSKDLYPDIRTKSFMAWISQQADITIPKRAPMRLKVLQKHRRK